MMTYLELIKPELVFGLLLIMVGFIAGAINLYIASVQEESVLFLGAGAFLIGYGIIGIIELIMGDRLVNASSRWDKLQSWKKFTISLVIILVAIIGFISLIPVVAEI